jgi:hypothetical protein
VPDKAGDLASAEQELARLRGIVANTVDWIHNPAHDGEARCALARHLGLPEPSQRTTTPSPTSADLIAIRLLPDRGVTIVQVLESKEG